MSESRDDLQSVEDLREVDHGEGPGMVYAAVMSGLCVLTLVAYAAIVIRVFG